MHGCTFPSRTIEPQSRRRAETNMARKQKVTEAVGVRLDYIRLGDLRSYPGNLLDSVRVLDLTHDDQIVATTLADLVKRKKGVKRPRQHQ